MFWPCFTSAKVQYGLLKKLITDVGFIGLQGLKHGF